MDQARLEQALRHFHVDCSHDEVAYLAKVASCTIDVQARRFGHKSLEDLFGSDGMARMEDATAVARGTLRSWLTAVANFDSLPGLIGEIDPIAAAAESALRRPEDATETYASDIADAVRGVSQRIAAALADVPEAVTLLRQAQVIKSEVGRPTRGVDLRQKLIRATYYAWERLGREMAVSVDTSGSAPGASELIRAAQAVLEASDIPGPKGAIRSELNAFRRNHLTVPSAMRGEVERRRAMKRDFLM